MDELESRLRRLLRDAAGRIGPVDVPPEPDPVRPRVVALRPAPSSRPGAHPVRSFASAIAAIALVCVGLVWITTSSSTHRPSIVSGTATTASVTTVAGPVTMSTLQPATTVPQTTAVVPSTSPPTTGVAATTPAHDGSLPVVAPTDGSTLLSLRKDAPRLQVTRTLFDLEGYDNGVIAPAPDGSIVVGRPAGNLLELVSVGVDGVPADLGITLGTGSTIFFGPGGDLFAGLIVERADGASMTLSRYRLSTTGSTMVDSVEAELLPACAFTITSSRVGCVEGMGPSIRIDPPVPLDLIDGDPGLTWVQRHGGGVERRWTIELDETADIECADGGCLSKFIAGPNGSVLWTPALTGTDDGAVFVLDDRPVAGSAFLPAGLRVLGMSGAELIGVQVDAAGSTIVAVDLSSIL